LAADSKPLENSWYAFSMFNLSGCGKLSTVSLVCEKAKELPISLANVPTLHQIAVGRNFESWWRYERGPVL